MMKRFLLGCAACIVMGTGCTKDQNVFIQAPGTDTVWVSQVGTGNAISHLADTLATQPSSDSIDLSQTSTLAIGGMRVILPAAWQTAAGAVFTGRAALQAVLMQKTGDWIRNFIPTAYGGKLIRTDAILYISVREGNSTLQPAGTMRLSIPAKSGFEMDSLFSGGYSGNQLQWTGTETYSYFSESPDSVTFATAQTGWLMYGTPLPDTVNTNAQLIVTLPNQFTNANSAVFCLLKGYPALVSLKGDYSSKTFIGSSLPAGSNATIITLTYTGGTFYLGTKNITLATGAFAVAISPTIETLPSLTAYLEQL
jgi:hypothetical protein